MNRPITGWAHGLVGQSPEIDQVRRLIDKAARADLPVLLLGESGTGKEVVARAIHNANPRGQFVPIDCGSLVGTLMESELFGHTKGAFSGAVENKKGLVELADGGTAFFDEIGDLPLEMQVKLLRLVQERQYRAVGSLQWKPIELRLIAATHRNLKTEVSAGRFRQDLYYRLNVFTLRLPPLRQRKSDIPLLIDAFSSPGFKPGRDMLEILQSYDWPGNVRELKNCVQRMEAMSSDGAQVADLPSALQYHLAGHGLHQLSEVMNAMPESGLPRAVLAPRSPVISIPDSNKEAIQQALAATGGNREKTAEILRIGRTTLYRKMREYGIASTRRAAAHSPVD